MEEAERRALAEVEEVRLREDDECLMWNILHLFPRLKPKSKVRLREEVKEAVGKERWNFRSNRGRSHFVFFLFLYLQVTRERSRRPTMAREWRILRQRRRASLPTLTNMSNMSSLSTLPLPTLTTLTTVTTLQNMSNVNSDAHPIKMRGNQEEPRSKDELESSLLSDAPLSKSTKDKDNQDATVNDPSVPDCSCYLEQMKGKQKGIVRGEL